MRFIGDVGQHRADLADAPRLSLVAIPKARREVEAVDAEERDLRAAGLDIAVQM